MNDRHGADAINRTRLADLSMQDVEAYNDHVVTSGHSASQVSKRMQLVKGIIDRAGRPEHGLQVLSWNWDSRDVRHGKPTEERTLFSGDDQTFVFSLECILKNLSVGSQVIDQLLKPGAFLLQILELAGLVGLEPAVLLAPEIVGLLGDPELSADFGDTYPLAEMDLRLSEFIDDLFCRIPFPGHDCPPSK